MNKTGFEHNGVWIEDPSKSPCGRFDLTPEQSLKEYGMNAQTKQKANQDYFAGFADDLDIPPSWKNVSWHNDACPSWQYNGWHIFIDHVDASQSECRDDGEPRFVIMPAADYGMGKNEQSIYSWTVVQKRVRVYAYKGQAQSLATEIRNGGYPITADVMKDVCIEKMSEEFGFKWDEQYEEFAHHVWNAVQDVNWNYSGGGM